MNLLIIDVETTGTDPKNTRIIQIAARHEKDRKVLAEFNQKIGKQEESTVDLMALKVNKTTYSALNSLGANEQTVLKEFVDFVLGLKEDKDDPLVLLGHNLAQFDLQFLNEGLARNNITGFQNLFARHIKDTSGLSAALIDAGYLQVKRHSLGNIAKALNIIVDEKQTHDGMYDVDLTSKVYYAIIDMLQGQRRILSPVSDERPSFKHNMPITQEV